MTTGDVGVLTLAAAVADGADVDWDHAESSAAGVDEQHVVQQLRLLATMATTARAQARTWGPLHLRGVVGRGASGTVHRAWDPRLDREVALKLLHVPIATEGHLLAQIRHPNVVTVYGADVFDGTAGIWMEFVTGRTLKEIVTEHGPLGAHEAALIGRDVCRALAAVHQRGFVHRDVKAQNVMREAGGRTVLMDFGAGYRLDRADAAGPLAGTPAYLAPEILAGAAATPQSDLYSVGVLLYFLVSGAFPVVAASIDALRERHAQGERTRLRDVRPDIPAAFARAVESATAAEPSQRPATAGALEALLDRALDGDVVPAEESPAWPSNQKTRRMVVLAIAAAALLGAVAAAWTVWDRQAPESSVISGVPRQITFAPGWEAEPALSPDGRLVAYSANDGNGTHVWISDVNGGNPLQITKGAGRETHPAWFPDGSAVAYAVSDGVHDSIWKTPPLGGSATLLVDDAKDPAISPDGSLIAVARTTAFARIGVARLTNPSQVRMVTGDRDGLWNHRSPAWSPDGRTLCYAAQNALWLVDIDTGRTVRLTTDGQFDRDPAWSADGRYIYFSSVREGTEAVWRVPAAGGAPMRVTFGTGPERQPNTSLHNGVLAYSTLTTGSDIAVVSLSAGATVRLPSVRDERTPAIAPDGRAIAFVSNRWAGRYDLWLQPIVAGHPDGAARRITDHPGSATYPAFSPDGRWIAYGRAVDDRRDIWLIPAAGGTSTRVTSDGVPHFHPSWSPDGAHIVYVAGENGRYRIEQVPVGSGRPTGPPTALLTASDPPLSPSWSPDGQQIAFVLNGEIWVAGMSGGDRRQLTHGADAQRVRWNRSTARLYASGTWGTSHVEVRRVDTTSGATASLGTELILGDGNDYVDFDVAADESLATIDHEDRRGDIWILRQQSQ